jgi:STE24 endopeptidase
MWVEVPEPSDLAVRFYRSGRWIWSSFTLWSLLLPWLVARSGGAERLRSWLETRRVPGWLQPSAIYAAVATALFAADLPWAYGLGFVRAHSYGLSVQTAGKWARDVGLGFLLELAFGVGAAWLLFLLLRRFPRTWWAILAALSIPVGAALVYVTPLVVDPLFNDFKPLADRALDSEITTLLDRAGIRDAEVFEVAKSVDTTAVNAYVTGFAGSHRVVLWDTLLAKLERREILSVVAHEAGHYALGHIVQGILLSGLGALALLFAVDRALTWRLRRAGVERATIARALADPAQVPRILLALAVVSTLASPIGLAVSRTMEHAADRFALDLTHDNEGAARAFIALQRSNLSYPRPARWLVWLRSSHPPLGDRIDFANRYAPWRDSASPAEPVAPLEPSGEAPR